MKMLLKGGGQSHTQTHSRACTVIKYIDPSAQRHTVQTFSGLIWLKGLWILLRKALSFFCTTFCPLSLGGYHWQKHALDIGYSSQLVAIPHAKIENRVLLTSCFRNSSTVTPVLSSFDSTAQRFFATRIAFPGFFFFGHFPFLDQCQLIQMPCKILVLI